MHSLNQSELGREIVAERVRLARSRRISRLIKPSKPPSRGRLAGVLSRPANRRVPSPRASR